MFISQIGTVFESNPKSLTFLLCHFSEFKLFEFSCQKSTSQSTISITDILARKFKYLKTANINIR